VNPPACTVTNPFGVHVTLDLPVMDYYAVQNLLAPGKTWFSLSCGRSSADPGAFDYVLGKMIPLAPLASDSQDR
jgi:cyclomaltodextrinase